MKRVVIVDNSKTNLLSAKKILSDEFQVDMLLNGADLFKYLNKYSPDLIMLSLKLADMNGFEAFRCLQTIPRTIRTPVIFFSESATSKTEAACFEIGAADFVMAPFSELVLRQRIRKAIELEEYRKNLEHLVSIQLQKVSEIQQSIVISLGNLIESRDGTTGEHVKRTSVYAGFLIQMMRQKKLYIEELTPKFCDMVLRVAPLHDIGKITVPDRILKKKGPLTSEEYTCIKTHTNLGGDFIKNNIGHLGEDFVTMAYDVVTYHHEKWDGTGYPLGLAEDEIPLSARIIAIADVFDALVSKRPYKEAMSMQEAFSIMKTERGKAFESDLLDAFTESPCVLSELMTTIN